MESGDAISLVEQSSDPQSDYGYQEPSGSSDVQLHVAPLWILTLYPSFFSLHFLLNLFIVTWECAITFTFSIGLLGIMQMAGEWVNSAGW